MKDTNLIEISRTDLKKLLNPTYNKPLKKVIITKVKPIKKVIIKVKAKKKNTIDKVKTLPILDAELTSEINLLYECKAIKKKQRLKEYNKQIEVFTSLYKYDLTNYELVGFDKHHVDHKISRKFGFDNNIPADVISHISNLRIISCKDNGAKGSSNFIDKNNQWIIKYFV